MLGKAWWGGGGGGGVGVKCEACDECVCLLIQIIESTIVIDNTTSMMHRRCNSTHPCGMACQFNACGFMRCVLKICVYVDNGGVFVWVWTCMCVVNCVLVTTSNGVNNAVDLHSRPLGWGG